MGKSRKRSARGTAEAAKRDLSTEQHSAAIKAGLAVREGTITSPFSCLPSQRWVGRELGTGSSGEVREVLHLLLVAYQQQAQTEVWSHFSCPLPARKLPG
jgi:hypothetical protein